MVGILRLFSDSSPQLLLKEDAEATMQHLTNLGQHTSVSACKKKKTMKLMDSIFH